MKQQTLIKFLCEYLDESVALGIYVALLYRMKKMKKNAILIKNNGEFIKIKEN